MGDTLINKIANSGLITLRPEDWAPDQQPSSFDLKDYLFMELILKEQDFRAAIKAHDWLKYSDRPLCVYCSTDAIIPYWAYMLVATNASPYTGEVFYGSPSQWMSQKLLAHIDALDTSEFADQRVIIKGCTDGVEIGPEIYTALTMKLVPVVKSLMFGEPCSTVPVYKRPK